MAYEPSESVVRFWQLCEAAGLSQTGNDTAKLNGLARVVRIYLGRFDEAPLGRLCVLAGGPNGGQVWAEDLSGTCNRESLFAWVSRQAEIATSAYAAAKEASEQG